MSIVNCLLYISNKCGNIIKFNKLRRNVHDVVCFPLTKEVPVIEFES